MGDAVIVVTDEFVDIHDYNPDSLDNALRAGSDNKIVGEDTVVLDASKITGRVQTRRIEVAGEPALQNTRTGQRISYGIMTPRYDGTAALKSDDAREMFKTPPFALEAVCSEIPYSQLPSAEVVKPSDETVYMKPDSGPKDMDDLLAEPPITKRVRRLTKSARFEP